MRNISYGDKNSTIQQRNLICFSLDSIKDSKLRELMRIVFA